MSMTCDHSALHSGGARFMRETSQLRLVLVCDGCGAERIELERVEYSPKARFFGHLAELTARELGLSESKIAKIGFAALVCAAGREQIQPEILNKQGALTDEEWAELCREPELAAALLSDTTFDDVREWILCHRERPDGSGYPRGLQGEQIPLEARILAVTEAYAAMTSDRPHRLARDHSDACLELLRGTGTQFDEAAVQAFLHATSRRDRHPAGTPASIAFAGGTASGCDSSMARMWVSTSSAAPLRPMIR
jgi:response regulator RpfG family c-di-GMP phosphodiesterase